MNDRDSSRETTRMGKIMTVMAWLLALVVLSLLFQGYLDKQYNPNQQYGMQATSSGSGEVVLQRNRYGQYVTSGLINGSEVELLFDTGASDVSVPVRLADSLGLQRGQPAIYETANGTITAYRTRIEEIRIGDIVLRDINASINPAVADGTILLGMSFLRHLEFTQRGDTLILRQ